VRADLPPTLAPLHRLSRGRLCAPWYPIVAPKCHLAQFLYTAVSMSATKFAVIRSENAVKIMNTAVRSLSAHTLPRSLYQPPQRSRAGVSRATAVGSGRGRSELPLMLLFWSATMPAQERGTLPLPFPLGGLGACPHFQSFGRRARRPTLEGGQNWEEEAKTDRPPDPLTGGHNPPERALEVASDKLLLSR